MFITPGTPRIVVISYSMNYGIRNCIWTALGDVTANIIQACLVIFVIGSFISDNPTLLNIFKWFGVIYIPVSYTHLRAHETLRHLVCRLLLEKNGQLEASLK